MNTEITFQKALLNDNDLNIFISLQNSVADPKTYTQGYVSKRMAICRFKKSFVYFIKEGDVTVGVIEYQDKRFFRRYAYIFGFVIAPNYQNRGIGHRALSLFIENHLKDFRIVKLGTHQENKALNLYKSLGFIIYGEREGRTPNEIYYLLIFKR